MKYFIVIVVVLASALFIWKQLNKPDILTNSFEQCVQAGYPVQESFPEQCRTPDGRTFTNTKANAEQEVTVTGEIVCLPHKDKEGPQTLECAFGIMNEEGQYYALSDPDMKYITTLPTGKNASVTGGLKSSPDSIYDIVGAIEITSVNIN